MKISIHTSTHDNDTYREIELGINDIAPFVELLKQYHTEDSDADEYEFNDFYYDAEGNNFEVYLTEKTEPMK